MATTTNYALEKPAQGVTPWDTLINGNSDIIDGQMKSNADAAAAAQGDATQGIADAAAAQGDATQALADAAAALEAGIPPRNMVLVDPSKTPVAGKIFADWATADTYVATQTPSAASPWAIIFSAGTHSDAIVLRDHVSNIGQGLGITIFSGSITSDLNAGFTTLYTSGIQNATVDNLTGAAGRPAILRNGEITGGTYAAGALIGFGCIWRGGDFSAAVSLCNFIGGGIPSGSTTTLPSIANLQNCDISSGVLNGGTFLSEHFKPTTINAGTYQIKGCDIGDDYAFPAGSSIVIESCSGVRTLTVTGSTVELRNSAGITLVDAANDVKLVETFTNDSTEASMAAIGGSATFGNSYLSWRRIGRKIIMDMLFEGTNAVALNEYECDLEAEYGSGIGGTFPFPSIENISITQVSGSGGISATLNGAPLPIGVQIGVGQLTIKGAMADFTAATFFMKIHVEFYISADVLVGS